MNQHVQNMHRHVHIQANICVCELCAGTLRPRPLIWSFTFNHKDINRSYWEINRLLVSTERVASIPFIPTISKNTNIQYTEYYIRNNSMQLVALTFTLSMLHHENDSFSFTDHYICVRGKCFFMAFVRDLCYISCLIRSHHSHLSCFQLW